MNSLIESSQAFSIKGLKPNTLMKERTNKRPESEERLPPSKLYEKLLLKLSVDCCKLGIERTPLLCLVWFGCFTLTQN